MHSAAVRRTAAAIMTASKPGREVSQLLREVRGPGQVSAVVCPETAARRARAILAQSNDPVQDVPAILK